MKFCRVKQAMFTKILPSGSRTGERGSYRKIYFSTNSTASTYIRG